MKLVSSLFVEANFLFIAAIIPADPLDYFPG